MRVLIRWFRSLFLHRRLERDMQEEMAAHLERATRRLMTRGLSYDQARKAALREFGNVDYLQEQARDARGGLWLEALTPDTKLAFRMLVKHPALSLVGVLGMAVAIALGTGFFTFLVFFYSAPPVPGGERLVTVDYIDDDPCRSTLFDYRLWRDGLASVEHLAAYRTTTRWLASSLGGASSVEVAEMTASGFRAAQVPPLLGRPLVDDDLIEGAAPVLVIGHQEWQRQFGASDDVLGTEVSIDGTTHTIVGVMPEGFRFPAHHGFWVPLEGTTRVAGRDEENRVCVFGRLATGVDRAAAQEEAIALGQGVREERAVVLPFIRHLLDVQHYSPYLLWLAQIVPALILAAVAANVAALFYARVALRRGEITVRTALGASRGRIVTQLGLEALVLSGCAAVVGYLIASIGFRQVVNLPKVRDEAPYWLSGNLPLETTLYAAVLALVAAAIVGVVPALQATGRHVQATLRELTGGTDARMGRTWTAVICMQVAVAVGVLPAIVGIAWNDAPPPTPGFEASEVLSFRLEPHAELLREVRGIPGVLGVTYGSTLPMRGRNVPIELERSTHTAESAPVAMVQEIGPDYFAVLGVEVVAGRAFDRSDFETPTAAAIVNRSFVELHLPQGNPLGARFRQVADEESPGGTEPWYEVVGVVDDVLKPARLGRPLPAMYRPLPEATPHTVLARTRGAEASTLVARVRDIGGDIAPGHELTAMPLDAVYRADRSLHRFFVGVVSLITLAVLLLSAAGISAMMSFAVTRRNREIGIRAALGASPGALIRTILARSTRQLGAGLLIGLVAAAVVDRLAGGELVGDQALPILTFVATLMCLAGALATLAPARRALRVPPMEALSSD